MDSLLQLKIYSLASIKTIPKDRDTLIEQSQPNLSDCSIRVSDCYIRVSRFFPDFVLVMIVYVPLRIFL